MSFVVSPRGQGAADPPSVDGALPPGRRTHAVWLALLVFVVGMLVTLAAGAWLQRIDETHSQEVIDHSIGEVAAMLEASIADHIARMRAVAAFIGASEQVSLEEWRSFVSVSGLAALQSRGAAGLAYAPRIMPFQRADWEHAMMRVHHRPITLRAREQGEAFPLQFVAPETEGLNRVLGLDLMLDDTRRTAIEAAAARGDVVLSDQVTLKDGGDDAIAGVFVLPVMHATRRMTSVDVRDSALRGVVILGLRYKRWITAVTAPWQDEYAFELVDETGGSAFTILAAPQTAVRHGGDHLLQVGGRNLRLRFYPLTPLVPSLARTTTLVAGLLLSAALASMTWLLVSGRARALAVAQRAVAGLAESERRFALAISATSDGVWEWDSGQRGLFLSQRARAILEPGLPTSGASWRTLLRAMAPGERRALIVALRSHLKHRHSLDVAVALADAHGSAQYLRIRGQAEWDVFGRVLRIAGAVSDVTTLRRRETELDRARRFHARLLDLLPHPVLVKSADHRYVLVNRAGAEFFDTGPESILDRRTADLLPGQGEAHEALDKQVMREGDIATGEFHLTLTNGSDRSVIVRKAAVPGPEGENVVLEVITDVTELRRTEAALKASLADLDSLFRYSPLGMALIRVDGSIVRVNRAFARMVGISAAQLPGMRYVQITPMHCRALDRAKTIEALRHGAVTPYERAFVRPDGREVPVVLSCAVTRDADGGTRLWTVAEDISERKAVEAALQHALATNQSMLDAIPDTLVQFDADLKLVAHKPGDDEAIPEFPPRRIGAALADLVSPRRYAAIEPVLRRAMHECKAQQIDYRGHDRNGVLQDYDAVVTPVTTGGTLVILRNATRRMRLETALHESETRFRQLADAAPVVVWMSDAHLNVIWVNRAWVALTHSNMDASQGAGWMDCVHPDDRPRAKAVGRKVLRTHEDYTLELRVRRFDGTWRWLHAAGVPRVGDDGEFAGFVGCGSDFTDEKQALQEVRGHRDHLAELVAAQTADLLCAKDRAERASEAKSLFLANMSHELRSPMHAILGYARLGEARSAQLTPERVTDYFARIHSSGGRLLDLLNSLLDLSRLESGRMKLDLKPIDLRGVVDEAVSAFEPLAAARRLRMETQAEDALPNVLADAMRISQVVRNLLANAIRYSPEGGAIALRLGSAALPVGRRASDSARRAGVSLIISDTGVGIPGDELERVFDTFVQSTKTRNGAGGTGLGLAICKQIVVAHHGIIRAESPPEGGARLTTIIPAAHTPAPRAARQRSHTS